MSNIQLDIEWTEAASRKIEKLMPRGGQEAYLALPPVECLPMEGDVLFLGPDGKQQPFIVAERQYHHDGLDHHPDPRRPAVDALNVSRIRRVHRPQWPAPAHLRRLADRHA